MEHRDISHGARSVPPRRLLRRLVLLLELLLHLVSAGKLRCEYCDSRICGQHLRCSVRPLALCYRLHDP